MTWFIIDYTFIDEIATHALALAMTEYNLDQEKSRAFWEHSVRRVPSVRESGRDDSEASSGFTP